MAQWRCTVCGFIFEGDTPPAACPVCGLGPEVFERVDGPAAGTQGGREPGASAGAGEAAVERPASDGAEEAAAQAGESAAQASADVASPSAAAPDAMSHATSAPAFGGSRTMSEEARARFAAGRPPELHDVDETEPFFGYDPDVCIRCKTCVATCATVQGNGILTLEEVEGGTRIMASGGWWGDSACEHCGNCVTTCPVGALYTKKSRTYPADEARTVRSTCANCGVGCQVDLVVHDGRLREVKPANGPANKGILCVKGRFASVDYVNHPDRLTHPLIKENGAFRRASWDEALSTIARRIGDIRRESGADAIGGFSSSRCTNEENFLFQKMMRCAVGTNNVDQCSRVCHSASMAGLARTLGSGAMTDSLDDVAESDLVFLIGANPEEAHAVFGSRLRRAAIRGTRFIVADPRSIGLARRAQMHLRLHPGTNILLVNAMIHTVIEEGLYDRDFIERRTEGFDELAESVRDYAPEQVARRVGVDARDIRAAARAYARAKTAAIVYCLGVTEHATGTRGVMALSNLAAACGKLGRPGCGVNPLRGQNNVQGACDMGALPDKFSGYRSVRDAAARAAHERAWGAAIPREPGLPLTDMVNAAERGDIRALYIMGENPLVTDPDLAHVRAAFANLDFLAVQDIFLTETAQMADVVLPASCYAEKDGTFTNTERRVQRVRKAVEAPGEARADADIICLVAGALGYPMAYDGAGDVFAEMAALTPTYAGMSYDRLGEDGLQWPCPDADHPGTPVMHERAFARAGGKALFVPCAYEPARETPDAEYPLLLSTGRVLSQYNAGNLTSKAEGMELVERGSFIEMHEDDALDLALRDGDRVRVSSRRGVVEARVRTSRTRTRRGEAWMPLHFSDGYVNELTIAALDDAARIPEYKVCAVRVEAVGA